MAGDTIVAAFDDYSGALSAIREMELGESAIAGISLVANNAGNRYGTFPQPRSRPEGAGDTFLARIGAVVLPSVGPVVAAGPMAAALGRGLGFVDALVEIGVPRAPAELYAVAVRRAATLVAAQVDPEHRDYASGTLERYRPMHIDERAAEWRREGWRGFDERGAPHPGPYYGSATTASGAPADQGVSVELWPEGGSPPGGWTIRQEGPVGADRNAPRVRVYSPDIDKIPGKGRD
jgi:hypothetical protein